jgi:hypothetical protein
LILQAEYTLQKEILTFKKFNKKQQSFLFHFWYNFIPREAKHEVEKMTFIGSEVN